jgi:hypothetical protein
MHINICHTYILKIKILDCKNSNELINRIVKTISQFDKVQLSKIVFQSDSVLKSQAKLERLSQAKSSFCSDCVIAKHWIWVERNLSWCLCSFFLLILEKGNCKILSHHDDTFKLKRNNFNERNGGSSTAQWEGKAGIKKGMLLCNANSSFV